MTMYRIKKNQIRESSVDRDKMCQKESSQEQVKEQRELKKQWKSEKRQRKRGLSGERRRITKRILARYVAGLLIYLLFVVFLFLLAWRICGNRIWYPQEPLYWKLRWVKEHAIELIAAICLVGWGAITRHFIAKWMGFLDEVIFATEQMADLSDTPIVLSEEMKAVQDDLNLIRLNAIRHASLAKEAEQRKNDLIVYLAHDLKTPLTSVIGYLTLLRDEPQISEELRSKYTGIALGKAERLEDLINEFFDITRFNLMTIELEKEQVNLSRMLSQIASEFEPLLVEKGLCWKLELAADVLMVCDPDKMMRVLDNLIRNAINYSYCNTAICLRLLEEGERIVIQVKNQGKTISPEKLARIFEQFFRLDSARASSTGGAGLGLAISKKIVELHGGSITAESENESITFTVVF